MTTVPPRTRAPAARNTAGRVPASQQSEDWLRRGQAGREQSEAEIQEAKARQEKRSQGTAYRFWLGKGEEARIIVLDATVENIPFMYEHSLQDEHGNWTDNELCVKDFASCPICNGEGVFTKPHQPYYAMYLSVLDTRGYVNRDNEEVPFSRKLLVVKAGQHPDFFRLFDAAMKTHGTIRGMELCMNRDDNKNSSGIGKAVIFDDDLTQTPGMFSMWSEEDLEANFSHDAITNSSGAVITPANGQLQPFDYLKLFPKPDPDAIRQKYKAAPIPGSRAANAAEVPSGRVARSRTPAAAPAQDNQPAPAGRRPPQRTAPAQTAAAPASRVPARAPAPSRTPAPPARTVTRTRTID